MVKRVGKRFLPIALALVMILSLMPVVYAADPVEGLSDPSIGLESNDGTWTASGTTINGSATGSGGRCAKEATGTLTIRNNKPSAATLSFSYTPTLNGGTVNLAGTNVTAAGTFSRELAAGGSISIKITTAKDAKTTSIKITNINLFADVTVTTTFLPPAVGGTYTVDGAAVTSTIQKTQSSTQPISMQATPSSGYRFFGWKSMPSGTIVSTAATWSNGFDVAQTIQPVFAKSGAAVFQVGKEYFDDLNAAKNAAVNGSDKKIAVAGNGTVAAGDYHIPNGVTLLVPYDVGYTVSTTSTGVVNNSYSKPTVFRTLTMAANAKITVESGGAISVASQISAHGTGSSSHNGTPTGPYGKIDMKAGSSITVQSGGGLYAYGFITGDGSVEARSGATVYECFQIRDWRGGSATMGIANDVFPFNQYYVQNIEVPLTIDAGATEMAFSAANAPTYNLYPSLGVEFIGSGGMFRLTSGSLTKRYDKAADRMIIDLNNAEGQISSIVLNGLPLVDTIDTTDYVLPLSNKFSIHVNSGSNVTVNQDIAMLPGTQLTIAEGAITNVSAGADIYVYDGNEWNGKSFAAGGNPFNVAAYVASRNGAGVILDADKADAQITVNGTLNMNGNLYTSATGANITSEGTGTIVLNAQPKSGTVNESEGTTGKVTKVSFNPARLHNGVNTSQYAGTDEEYTATEGAVSGDRFLYSAKADKWMKNPQTVTWLNEDGTALCDPDLVGRGDMPVYDGDIPTKAEDAESYYVFSGWDKALEPVTGDVTYTARYDAKALNFGIEVYYNVNGVQGEEAVYTRQFGYKQSVRLGADEQYKDGDDVYTFSHWDVDGVAYPALKITVHPDSVDHTVIAQAVYVKNASDAMYKGDAFVKIVRADPETIGPDTTKTQHNMVFTLTQSVPAGTAEEVGFLISQTVQNPTGPADNVFNPVSKLTTQTSTFTARVDVNGWEGKPLYVRAYVKYGGVTIYSDEPAVVYTFPTV